MSALASALALALASAQRQNYESVRSQCRRPNCLVGLGLPYDAHYDCIVRSTTCTIMTSSMTTTTTTDVRPDFWRRSSAQFPFSFRQSADSKSNPNSNRIMCPRNATATAAAAAAHAHPPSSPPPPSEGVRCGRSDGRMATLALRGQVNSIKSESSSGAAVRWRPHLNCAATDQSAHCAFLSRKTAHAKVENALKPKRRAEKSTLHCSTVQSPLAHKRRQH